VGWLGSSGGVTNGDIDDDKDIIFLYNMPVLYLSSLLLFSVRIRCPHKAV
jgi:hypothetical protein